MTSDVQDQYEAYPYPPRDPQEEKTRLVTGSPSDPIEMDHFLWAGRRDWSKPIRILVAGGGTGDALIQMAARLTAANRPYEIAYVDLSTASRKVAEERAKIRGLGGIDFTTGSLLDAPDLGEFDYIDCCGVLHHLPDPQAGFDALSKALAPEGGIGLMVYAPYGRSGVYPLQEAFNELYAGHTHEDRVAAAKSVFSKLPEGHLFKRNPHLNDHKTGDAGFYDLLLHSSDVPFSISKLFDTLKNAGLKATGTPNAMQYALSRFLDPVPEMEDERAMALAEKLDGTIKHHVFYATRIEGAAPGAATGKDRDTPHLRGVDPAQLSQHIAKGKGLNIKLFGTDHHIEIPKTAAPILAQINGRRDIKEIRARSKCDPILWAQSWPKTEAQLRKFGIMLYSTLLKA